VCPLVVYLSDEHVHRSRFYIRALGTAMRRPAEEYISYFHEIRQIHDYIVESSTRAGVQAIENLFIENTSDAAVEIVANRVSGIAERAGRRAASLLLDAGMSTSTPRRGVPISRAESG
jgi:2-phosphoglycerate kinase